MFKSGIVSAEKARLNTQKLSVPRLEQRERKEARQKLVLGRWLGLGRLGLELARRRCKKATGNRSVDA